LTSACRRAHIDRNVETGGLFNSMKTIGSRAADIFSAAMHNGTPQKYCAPDEIGIKVRPVIHAVGRVRPRWQPIADG
jgi:hypothetical protein